MRQVLRLKHGLPSTSPVSTGSEDEDVSMNPERMWFQYRTEDEMRKENEKSEHGTTK